MITIDNVYYGFLTLFGSLAVWFLVAHFLFAVGLGWDKVVSSYGAGAVSIMFSHYIGGSMATSISLGLVLFIILLLWLYWAEFTKPKLLKAKGWIVAKYTTIKNDIKVAKLWDKQD